MTTFQSGDRVVVESPVYMPDRLYNAEEDTHGVVHVGAMGDIDGGPDSDGDYLVEIDGASGPYYVAAEGLLLVDDLDALAAERAPIKVGDRVVIERAIWRTSGAGLQDHADYGESDRPKVGDEFTVGRFSDSPNIVGPHVSSPDGWLLSVEGLRKVDPEPEAPAPAEAPISRGDLVEVTSEAGLHGFPVGTVVRALEDVDYSGSFLATTLPEGSSSEWKEGVTAYLGNAVYSDYDEPKPNYRRVTPTPDPVRIDVRFYIGDVDVTAHIAGALKEAA